MYICMGKLNINVDKISYYFINIDKSVLSIYFTETDYATFNSKDYDLDILILELDRVCNPKVLKGKLDEK